MVGASLLTTSGRRHGAYDVVHCQTHNTHNDAITANHNEQNTPPGKARVNCKHIHVLKKLLNFHKLIRATLFMLSDTKLMM